MKGQTYSLRRNPPYKSPYLTSSNILLKVLDTFPKFLIQDQAKNKKKQGQKQKPKNQRYSNDPDPKQFGFTNYGQYKKNNNYQTLHSRSINNSKASSDNKSLTHKRFYCSQKKVNLVQPLSPLKIQFEQTKPIPKPQITNFTSEGFFKRKQNYKKENKINIRRLNKKDQLDKNLKKAYGISPQKPKKFLPKIQQKQEIIPKKVQVDNLDQKKSLLWIFFLSIQIQKQDQEKIEKLYNFDKFNQQKKNNIVPICKNLQDFKKMLEIPHSYFTIVTDIQNVQAVLQFKKNQKIRKIYIYFNDNTKNQNQEIQQWKKVNKAINLKNDHAMIQGVRFDFKELLEAASQEIQSEVKLTEDKEKNINQKVPKIIQTCFYRLTQYENSVANFHRNIQYFCQKLDFQNRKKYYEKTMDYLKKYPNKQLVNDESIKKYKEISQYFLKQRPQLKTGAIEIIRMYTYQSFFYIILNKMLRTALYLHQFQPCVFMYFQIYTSIKFLYDYKIQNQSRIISRKKLYRGLNMRQRQFNSLRQGNFIQVYQTLSTSQNEQKAIGFISFQNPGVKCLIQFQIPQMQIPLLYSKFFSGFLNLNELLSSNYTDQEQFLINCLSIFQVLQITKQPEPNPYQQKLSGVKQQFFYRIKLKLGSIYQLMKEPTQTLNNSQKNIINYYKHCMKKQESFKDISDYYRQINCQDKALQQLNNLIDKQKNVIDKAFLKARKAQMINSNGKSDQACEIMQQAIKQIYQQKNKQKNNLKQCFDVYKIHKTYACILHSQQKYIEQRQQLHNAIRYIQQKDKLQRSRLLKKLAINQFKVGQINRSQIFYKKAQKQLQQYRQELINPSIDLLKAINDVAKVIIPGNNFSFQDYRQNNQNQKLKNQRTRMISQKILYQIKVELSNVLDARIKVSQLLGNDQQYQLCIKKALDNLKDVDVNTDDPYIFLKKILLQFLKQGKKMNFQTKQNKLNEAIKKFEQCKQNYHVAVSQICQYFSRLEHQQAKNFSKNKYYLTQNLSEIDQSQIQIRLEQQRKKIQLNGIDHIRKGMKILVRNNIHEQSPQILKLKNLYIESMVSMNKYQQAQNAAYSFNLQDIQNKVHHQYAKASLTLSKISLLRGQFKASLKSLDTAQQILQNIIHKNQIKRNQQFKKSQQKNINTNKKQNNEKYKKNELDKNDLRNNLQNNINNEMLKIFKQFNHYFDIYLQIFIYKAKVYGQQNKIQKADQYLKKSQNMIKRLKRYQSHNLYSVLLQEQGYLQSIKEKKNIQVIKSNFEKSFKIKSCLDGFYNRDLLFSKYRYTKILFDFKQKVESQKRRKQILKIFQKVSQDDPYHWIVYYLQGLFMTHSKILASKTIKIAIKHMQKECNKSYILLSSIKLQYLEILWQINKQDFHVAKYQQLQNHLENLLIRSNKRQSLNNSQDDKKHNIYINLITKANEQLSAIQNQQQNIIKIKTKNEMKLCYKQNVGQLIKMLKKD